ncbi:glutathione S-transferase family protein [Limoniibacter endophyticus]|uniref:Glutathione S-transferase n=1 Tax=Limoniibacter endophyticus TaxID=1565040 RepID=A0A8J3DRC8_9HYPH|nr:glutathione S-transferase family protein [Limoniibacter endophyticus]GHC74595.1 glutathione S-transferase [Limoniibacter endophyticus]
MAEDIVLYTHPFSRGRIIRWMLEEIGAPYKTEIMNFGAGMKSADYLSINPMGKVPAIVHGKKIVTECAAICAYLADAFPERDLAPAPEDRADYYRWMFFAAGPLEAAISNKALGFKVPDDRRTMIGYGSFEDVVDTLEAALKGKDYIAAGRFTAADVYVGSHIGWGLQFGTLEKRAEFQRYLGGLAKRPAFQRATQLDDEAAKNLEKN